MVVTTRPPTAEVIDDQRTDWVRQYRHSHASADLWARGLRRVSHSIETQDRVFRMAAQLGHSGVDPIDLFLALNEADRCVALSDDPHGAEEAGHRAISMVMRLAPESVMICAQQDEPKLRAQGMDPLPFDGRDPAAYAWVMFELSSRANAERRSRWRRCVSEAFSTPTAIGLARL